jgi:hypothetical protein
MHTYNPWFYSMAVAILIKDTTFGFFAISIILVSPNISKPSLADNSSQALPTKYMQYGPHFVQTGFVQNSTQLRF